jgi:DNA polymerase III alpha subunit
MNAIIIHRGLVFLAQAAPLSVGELLANADRFNGQPVTVTGIISNLRGQPLRRGAAVYTFDLSDGTATVYVTVFAAKPLCQSGAVVVEGTFGQTKWRVNASHSFKEITARTVTCLPERRANCRLMTRRTLKTHDGPAHESHRDDGRLAAQSNAELPR